MSVDIVTITYRNTEKLKTCLQSVIERTKYVDYKWYLMANDPNNEVKQIIHDSIHTDGIKFTNRVEPIFNDTNDGSYASNNNEVAKEGKGDYILFLNDDVEPLRDDWLLNMTRILDTDQKVGIVGALLIYPDRKTIQHCGVFFSNRTNNMPYHMLYRQSLEKSKNFISVSRYYQAVTGACLLARRSDFEAVGGFDERLYYQFEDILYCLMVHKMLNKHSVYCSTAELIHNEGISKSGKQNPRWESNVKIFKDLSKDLFFNDFEFYENNTKHMIYRQKI